MLVGVQKREKMSKKKNRYKDNGAVEVVLHSTFAFFQFVSADFLVPDWEWEN